MKKYFILVLLFIPSLKAQAQYWQQHAEYYMDFKMDVSDFSFTGEQELVYTNNSPDTITKVYYHLFFNAFRPGSQMDVRSRTIRDPDSRIGSRIFELEEKDYGELNVFSLKQNGRSLEISQRETILLAKLNKPLLPGEKTTLEMKFEGQVPKQIRRSGKMSEEGVHLTMTQWFPKLCEYDSEGWHPNPYIAREFHGVWGNYTVDITIDKNYVVGGTGYLMNADEIGHGYAEMTKSKNKESLTWRFYAPNVHDFAWAADPEYAHDIVTSKTGVDLHFFYKPTVNIDDWKKLQDDSLKLLEYFEQNIGPYPWKQYSIIQGGDGGMEYAMCTMITGERPYPSLLGVTAHEMSHAWHQHVLATNEAKHPWMDEGFTEYATSHSLNYVNGVNPLFPNESSYELYYVLANSGVEQPQTVHSDRYDFNFAYGASAYSKGSVFMAQLGYIIGEESLKKTIKRYYEGFKFKHPTPNDFKRVAEKVSGVELEWYLNDWTRTANKIDYSLDISDVIPNRVVKIKRKGRIPMPLDVVVSFEDGTSEMYYIPNDLLYLDDSSSDIITDQKLEHPVYKNSLSKIKALKSWNWVTPEYSFVVDGNKKIVKIEIDPSKRLADVNSADNSISFE